MGTTTFDLSEDSITNYNAVAPGCDCDCGPAETEGCCGVYPVDRLLTATLNKIDNECDDLDGSTLPLTWESDGMGSGSWKTAGYDANDYISPTGVKNSCDSTFQFKLTCGGGNICADWELFGDDDLGDCTGGDDSLVAADPCTCYPIFKLVFGPWTTTSDLCDCCDTDAKEWSVTITETP